jgi:ABC-type branched-subunit amino acid transport system ATPase component
MVANLLPRTIILDGGRVITDGPSRDILNDGDLLLAHQLEPLSMHGHPHA